MCFRKRVFHCMRQLPVCCAQSSEDAGNGKSSALHLALEPSIFSYLRCFSILLIACVPGLPLALGQTCTHHVSTPTVSVSVKPAFHMLRNITNSRETCPVEPKCRGLLYTALQIV